MKNRNFYYEENFYDFYEEKSNYKSRKSAKKDGESRRHIKTTRYSALRAEKRGW